MLLLSVVFVSLNIHLAINYVGFLTGDEVELIESALKITMDTNYQPWNIRNLLISNLIFSPILSAAKLIGTPNPMMFILITRIIVIGFSALSIWFVFLICRQLTDDYTCPFIASYFYAFSFLTMTFSSSGFARQISTTFILAALLILVKNEPDSRNFFFSGILMAVAFASRYSEIIFLVPMLCFLKKTESEHGSNLKQYILFLVSFLIGSLVFVGFFEKMVSGIFAGNFRAFITYTVIEGKCSSAEVIQSRFFYFQHVFDCIPWVVAPFVMIAAWRKKLSGIWLFAVIPVLLLSTLSHKELRYLQGIVPFVSIIAAFGATEILKTKVKVIGFLLIILYGITGFKDSSKLLRNKTMPAVRAAQMISSRDEIKRVALSQAWAYGNGIIIGQSKSIIELSKPFSFLEFQKIANDVDALSIYRSDYISQRENTMRILEEDFEILKEFDGTPTRAVVVFVKKRSSNFAPAFRYSSFPVRYW